MNPSSAPKPPRSAADACLPATSSPATAPRNGPKMMPNGAKKMPTIVPTMHPNTPHFEQLNFFAPSAGTT